MSGGTSMFAGGLQKRPTGFITISYNRLLQTRMKLLYMLNFKNTNF